MQLFSDLLVLGFAAYRLTQLITQDEGPFGLFLRLRAMLGAYDYNSFGIPETGLGRAISCPYCVGIYAAALMLLLYQWQVSRILVWWLAIAGVQALIQIIKDK